VRVMQYIYIYIYGERNEDTGCACVFSSVVKYVWYHSGYAPNVTQHQRHT